MLQAKQAFEDKDENASGYLYSPKWKLPDIIVSKNTFPKALKLAGLVYAAFEKRGYHVHLPARAQFRRPELSLRDGKDSYFYQRSWSPDRPTLAFVNDVPFSITIYEPSEEVAVVGRGEKQVLIGKPVEDPGWESGIRNEWLPSGRLAVRASVATGYSKWSETIVEKRKPIGEKAGGLVRAIERALPEIRAEEAQLEEQRTRQQKEWERQQAVWEKEQEDERWLADRQRATKELFSLMEEWGRMKHAEAFLQEREEAASNAGGSDGEALRSTGSPWPAA